MAQVKNYIIVIRSKTVARTDSLDSAKSWIKKAARQVASTGKYNGDTAYVVENRTGSYVYSEELPWDQAADDKKWGRTTNPASVLSQLRKGIRGTVKLSRGRLIIKT